ncbi:MAG: DNA polymerase III subunit gamma/tau [Bdellovibrionales bacterium]|nr:DNA polymerase III subunit gamma/tau [Bdellovibrionales bacterium]
MSYQVIARKWRPKGFEELVGQGHISQTLLNALQNNRLPHALLFTGPRGTGKTSSARILAKSLRCPNAKNFVPCLECNECLDISSGRSVNVIEIDGASNNGVEAIRELRDSVGYMPASGHYKVYIIDEVHMLSTSAFNALLKTLEEPPEHVVFIMATTEVHKIPNTILSRCQRFDFRRIPLKLITERLQSICKAEGLKVDDEALWAVARQGDGSMRDSQSLLDQVITFSKDHLTLKKVTEVLGLTERSLILEAMQSICHKKSDLALDVVEKVFSSGTDAQLFAKDLLEEIRHMMFAKMAPSPEEAAKLLDLPDFEIEELRGLAQNMSAEDIHMLFDMCLKGVQDLSRSQDSQIILEMMLIRLSQAPKIEELKTLLGQSEKKKPKLNTDSQRSSTNSQTSSSASEIKTPQKQQVSAQSKASEQANSSQSISQTQEKPQHQQAGSAQNVSQEPTKPQGQGSSKDSPSTQADNKNQINTANTQPEEKSQNFSQNPQSFSQEEPPPPPTEEPKQSLNVLKSKKKPKTKFKKLKTPLETKQPLEEHWYEVVSEVKKYQQILGAELENVFLDSCSQTEVTLSIPAKAKFLWDRFNDPEYQKRINKVFKTFWGMEFEIKVVQDKDKKSSELTPKAMHRKKIDAKNQETRKLVEDHPMVKQAHKLFKTEIKSIKELP